jgi:hypothetical protein
VAQADDGAHIWWWHAVVFCVGTDNRKRTTVAKLYFRYGAMNSGKSTALLQAAFNYEERGQRVLLAKPLIDTKGASQIVSGWA